MVRAPHRSSPLSPAAADLAWAAVYAACGVYWLIRHDLPDLFTSILYFDIIVTILSPWILAPGIILFAMLHARKEWRSLRFALGALGLCAVCALLLWGAGIVLHRYGGWSFVAAIPILLSKIPWRGFFSAGRMTGVRMLMQRGMLVPFTCFAPALIISCLILKRNTLDGLGSDWVGLFGVLYFVAQAILDRALLRRVSR